MANEYLTLDEFKDLRRIADSTSDTMLQRRITRASRAIDDRTGRRFWRDTEASERKFDALGGGCVVDDIATLDDLAITIDGSAIADYETYPLNAIAKGWAIDWLTHARFVNGSRLLVTAVWGWPTIPESIIEATFLLANRRYFRRDSPEGVSGAGTEGVTRLSRFDPDVEDLITPYVLDGFA